MTKFPIIVASLIVLASLTLFPSTTDAYDGYTSRFLGVYGSGYGGGLYSLGYLPVPPYYAIHPPVYYGERYFRSYGGSPFARRSYSYTHYRSNYRPVTYPNRQAVAGQLVMNPFVEQTPQVPSPPAEAKSDEKVTSKPLLIINPFYQPEQTAQIGG